MVLGLFLLMGCDMQEAEPMVLLDKKIVEVKISNSKGFGGMNENSFLSIKDKESLNIMEKAITTAMKQPGKADIKDPDYDVMVKYESKEGELPTHGLHLWLGEEDEQSMLMYIADDSVYLTSAEMTRKLRELLQIN